MNKLTLIALAAIAGFTFQTTTIFSVNACEEDDNNYKFEGNKQGKNKAKVKESSKLDHGVLLHSTNDSEAESSGNTEKQGKDK